jgi:tubulin monoglycylase TTLL3/8
MYKDCYFRTSSNKFDLKDLANRFVHLTNDAVQEHNEDYGKFESANKFSINDFQRYLDQQMPHLSISFTRDIFPRIERLVTDSFRAVYRRVDPSKLANQFEIFGFDFMIDEQFRVYLIECNTNPCIETPCPLL